MQISYVVGVTYNKMLLFMCNRFQIHLEVTKIFRFAITSFVSMAIDSYKTLVCQVLRVCKL